MRYLAVIERTRCSDFGPSTELDADMMHSSVSSYDKVLCPAWQVVEWVLAPVRAVWSAPSWPQHLASPQAFYSHYIDIQQDAQGRPQVRFLESASSIKMLHAFPQSSALQRTSNVSFQGHLIWTHAALVLRSLHRAGTLPVPANLSRTMAL